MQFCLALILSIPTENATERMRVWRALKASGAAVLRDGVYLLPETEPCRATFERVAADIKTAGGTTHLLRVEDADGTEFTRLFARGEDYALLLNEIAAVRNALQADNAADALKQTRKLRKTFAGVAAIDFFPDAAHTQTDAALHELEAQVSQILTPDEPRALEGAIPRLLASDYRGRLWATRQRPWVDRLASAWLIRKFIDPAARFIWMEPQTRCAPDVLGFDYDGAAFSHVGAKVTFEVLLASFGLEQPALKQIGALVHYLDVGGVMPAEAIGVERVLGGLRAAILDDDQLLQLASAIFDGLLTAFEKEISIP
jgi:hypothetical protein